MLTLLTVAVKYIVNAVAQGAIFSVANTLFEKGKEKVKEKKQKKK